MQIQGKAYRVSIYVGESNHYQGQSLSMALLEYLRREGASGATVLRGLAGFGAHSRIHTASIVALSTDLPIVVIWVDVPERVERLLPQVRKMVDDGLITLEEIQVIQYAPGRPPDPLEQPLRNIMRDEVLAVGPETNVAEVVQLLLHRGYRSLPVVDGDKRLLGIITDGDLLRRAGLETRLDLQTQLLPAQFQQQLTDLQTQSRTARDIMTRAVVTAEENDRVRVAVERMARRGLKRLPVVDGAGRLVGLVSRVDIFRAIEYHQESNSAQTEEAVRSGGSVPELMYRDVPTVGPQARLEEIINALEETRRRRVVVVDDDRRVLGIITDGDLLRRSRHAQDPGLLDRLRSLVIGKKETLPVLPSSHETASTLMTAPVITISMHTPLGEALRLMLDHAVKRLPVVDESGRLVGLLGRASVLEGLLAGEAPSSESK